jgi:hypothetical protein
MPSALKIAVLGIGAALAGSQGQLPTPPSADPLQGGTKPIVSREDLIGSYYLGDGLGQNCHLELMRDGTFKFRWTGCLGEYDKNSGRWQQKGDLVTLQPQRENRHEGFEGVNTRFVPVIWDNHLFLVDEYEAPGFLSTLRKGDPYGIDEIHGQDYIKVDGTSYEPVSIPGPSRFPERFRDFLEKGPVTARVVSISKDGTVVLNKGSKDRIRAGLMLGPIEWYTADLEVISVEDHRAVARAGFFFNSNRLVQVGDEYSTGGLYFRPHGTGWPRLPQPPER